jgi:hypothetical protein
MDIVARVLEASRDITRTFCCSAGTTPGNTVLRWPEFGKAEKCRAERETARKRRSKERWWLGSKCHMVPLTVAVIDPAANLTLPYLAV